MFPLGSPCTRLEELLISKCNQLHLLPDDLGEQLPCLRKLTLRKCESLAELSQNFTSLSRSETLVISTSHLLFHLPQKFGQLPALKVLVLESLPLSALPDSLCHLTSLQALYLMRSYLTSLPAGLCHLASLKSLWLVEMDQMVLPDDIGELPNLQTFHMSKDNQEFLPPSFTQLSSLTELEFDSCEIRELPEGIEELQNLRVVQLVDCVKIKELPESFSHVTHLESLQVDLKARLRWDEKHVRLSWVPRELGDLGRLKELALLGYELLYGNPELLPQSLEVLQLGNSVQETRLPDFSLLTYLKELTLHLPRVGRGAVVCRSLSRLEKLCLRLDGEAAGFPFPLRFPQLKLLTIWSKRLKRLPKSIGSTLPQLRQLKIESNELLEGLPARISELQSLTSLEIDVYRSRLSSVPAGISSLPRLRKLQVTGSGRVLQYLSVPP